MTFLLNSQCNLIAQTALSSKRAAAKWVLIKNKTEYLFFLGSSEDFFSTMHNWKDNKLNRSVRGKQAPYCKICFAVWKGTCEAHPLGWKNHRENSEHKKKHKETKIIDWHGIPIVRLLYVSSIVSCSFLFSLVTLLSYMSFDCFDVICLFYRCLSTVLKTESIGKFKLSFSHSCKVS